MQSSGAERTSAAAAAAAIFQFVGETSHRKASTITLWLRHERFVRHARAPVEPLVDDLLDAVQLVEELLRP